MNRITFLMFDARGWIIDYAGVLSAEYEANAFGYEQSEDEIVNGSLQFVKQLNS